MIPTDPMTEHISILPAEHADVAAMVAVRCEAAEEEIMTRLQHGSRHVDAVQSESKTLSDRLGKRFTEPTQRCHIAKAVDIQSGELIGWALYKWEDGSWVNTVPSAPGPNDKSDEPPNFSKYWSGEVTKKWATLVGGTPHVMIGAMNVKPEWQQRGIGRLIVEYFYREYDLDKETVIVQTTASAEKFYQKMGWTTVDATEIDLSDWKGKGMGYGLHRSPQMIRKPLKT